MKKVYIFIPLFLFLSLSFFFYQGLSLDPKQLPSQFVGKNAPKLNLPSFKQGEVISSQAMLGKVWLLNVFASWCMACLDEHAMLMDIKTHFDIPLIGLNYKDDKTSLAQWLKSYGNPYSQIAIDSDGLAAIDWGVYGAPETFIIDKKGVIRYRYVGVITPKSWQQQFIPLIEQLS